MRKKRTKKQTAIPPPAIEYYELCSYGPHVFLSRILEVACVSAASQGFKIGHAAFLSHSLSDLDLFAKDNEAEEMDFFGQNIPLGGIHYLLNGISGSQLNIREKRDAIYCFKGVVEQPVIAATISILGADSSRTVPIFASFIISSSKEQSVEFIHKYFATRRNKMTGKVLNQNGDQIDSFRRMNWTDLVLPDNISHDIQAEIDMFFNSEKIYKDHRIDWHRSILIVGQRGNGKTALCRAIASCSNVPVIYCILNENDILGTLNSLHSTLVLNAPCIAIIEDTDLINLDETLTTNFTNLLDGLCANEGVLTVATASAWDDHAGSDRFDSFYLIKNPGPIERKELLLKRLGAAGENLKNLSEIINAMDGFSAATIQEIAMQVIFASNKEKEPITEKIILETISKKQKRSEGSIVGFFTKDEN